MKKEHLEKSKMSFPKCLIEKVFVKSVPYGCPTEPFGHDNLIKKSNFARASKIINYRQGSPVILPAQNSRLLSGDVAAVQRTQACLKSKEAPGSCRERFTYIDKEILN